MNETATRILPCPSYDIEAVESWLTDQAKQGWYLERQGDYFGRFHFRKDVPRALPYRLVSSLESTTVLQQTRIHGSPPPQEVLDLAAYSGWEYVALIEGFYVYRGTTEHPREMETDPVLQSASIRKILGYKVLSFLVAIPLLFFRFFVFPPSSFRLSSLLLAHHRRPCDVCSHCKHGFGGILVGDALFAQTIPGSGAGPKLGSRKALAA